MVVTLVSPTQNFKLSSVSRFLLANLTCLCEHCIHEQLRVIGEGKSWYRCVDGDEWLERLAAIYDANKLKDLRQEFQRAREQASTPEQATTRVAKILTRLEARRADVSNFMKELNQRISTYVNRRNNRKGTLLLSRHCEYLPDD